MVAKVKVSVMPQPVKVGTISVCTRRAMRAEFVMPEGKVPKRRLEISRGVRASESRYSL